ncbi:uncharacterized protein JN550_000778 [Neoarthrinium moseri]|uniref:uncharacterized protein n=1 Tax=Neoarthrinium moseri TaxID=1658444 RepID=UPI001FDB831A|nr:uncharacterized protein JN550_000778 [Neoarthrinium moseri]KAI1876706.1 hypothetical protein JN550_000778 [Neoarthrinium moseri]
MEQRLAFAITRRRRQFKYWARHASKLSHVAPIQDQPHDNDVRPQVAPPPRSRKTQLAGKESRVNTLVIEEVKEPTALLSHTEATAYHEPIEDQTERGTVITAASTAFDSDGHYVDLPGPPAVSMLGDFVCPYCSVLCEQKYSRRNAWRTHLLHDLQPYICTYENCPESNCLFPSRTAWVDHETSFHRQSWRCFEHSLQFPTAPALKSHLLDDHIGSLTEKQMDSLVNLSFVGSVDERPYCPICFQEPPFAKGLETHLANHLERFAKFSLPKTYDQDDDSRGSLSTRSKRNSSRISEPTAAEILDEGTAETAFTMRVGQHPVRQPRGPPPMDELRTKPTAKYEGSKNFAARTRRSAVQNLMRAGLERRRHTVSLATQDASYFTPSTREESLDGSQEAQSNIPTARASTLHIPTTLHATAIQSYAPEEIGEIVLREGEPVTILEMTSDSWWTGCNAAGDKGLFLSNHVQYLEDPPSPPVEYETLFWWGAIDSRNNNKKRGRPSSHRSEGSFDSPESLGRKEDSSHDSDTWSGFIIEECNSDDYASDDPNVLKPYAFEYPESHASQKSCSVNLYPKTMQTMSALDVTTFLSDWSSEDEGNEADAERISEEWVKRSQARARRMASVGISKRTFTERDSDADTDREDLEPRETTNLRHRRRRNRADALAFLDEPELIIDLLEPKSDD